MQTVILIEDMACEHCAAKIDHALAETSIRYTVDLPRKAVIVNGTQDDVMKARRIIDEIGFFNLCPDTAGRSLRSRHL